MCLPVLLLKTLPVVTVKPDRARLARTLHFDWLLSCSAVNALTLCFEFNEDRPVLYYPRCIFCFTKKEADALPMAAKPSPYCRLF
jgi:hypothetical protein